MQIDRGLVLALFVGYTLKVAVLGASLPDAAVVLILAAAHFLYNSQVQNKQIVQFKQEISEFKNELAACKKVSDDLKTTMASVKISQGLMQKVR